MDRPIPEGTGEAGSALTDDQLEAMSIKYNIARIVRLSSGNFALFSPFDNDDGLQLVHVGDWESIHDFVPTAEECVVHIRNIHDAGSMAASDIRQGRNLLELIGLATPKEPLKRRI